MLDGKLIIPVRRHKDGIRAQPGGTGGVFRKDEPGHGGPFRVWHRVPAGWAGRKRSLTLLRQSAAMPTYIRPRVAGAAVFFTVALADRRSDLLVRQVDRLRDAVRRVRADRPFGIDAWVVLPDHLHAVWTLPAGDKDFSTRWGAIKAQFSMSVRRAGFTPPYGAKARSGCGSHGSGVRRARKTVLRTVFSAERAKPRRRSRPYPGSGRFRRPYPVLLGQSGKARSGRAGGGLALFLDPPRYPGWPRRTGVVWECARGAVWRVGRGSPRHGWSCVGMAG